jgi:hypothetical protein
MFLGELQTIIPMKDYKKIDSTIHLVFHKNDLIHPD